MTAILPQAPATTPPPDWAAFGPHRPLGSTDWRVWSVGLLRSAGFQIDQQPEPDVYVCRVAGQAARGSPQAA